MHLTISGAGQRRALPVTNRRGAVLHALLDIGEERLTGPLEHALTHALVVAWHGSQSLIMFNRFKQQWELPGGIIEPGEAARACAERELQEETGQRTGPLTYLGVMHVSFPSGRTEYGALYKADLEALSPFTGNDEAERILLWDGNKDVGYVNEIDAALVDLAR